MAIIEINGGPITHRYLMKKSKDELASMYMRLLRDTEPDAKDAERYRWLRENGRYSDKVMVDHADMGRVLRLEKQLDESIDAAR